MQCDCFKVSVPAHQISPLTGYIIETSFNTWVTWVIKIRNTKIREQKILGTLTYCVLNETKTSFVEKIADIVHSVLVHQLRL